MLIWLPGCARLPLHLRGRRAPGLLAGYDGRAGVTDRLYRIIDAAFPPLEVPPGTDGVLGYVGEVGFTPHVWTVAEWDRFAELGQFPAWLPNLSLPADVDADNAIAAVQALGWAVEPKPFTRAVVLDLETGKYPDWSLEWGTRVARRGYWPDDYGSMSTLLGNAAYDYWAADWDGIPLLQPGKRINGDQYAAGIAWENTTIDVSVVDLELWNRRGRGRRHG